MIGGKNEIGLVIYADIDGCIMPSRGNHTFHKHYLELFKKITSTRVFGFCTGRSSSYVEAISQILMVKKWCICENGSYLYHPIFDKVILNPLVTDEVISTLSFLKGLLCKDKYRSICKMELGKEVCISLNPINMPIEELFSIVSTEIDRNLLYVNHSTTAVDITPKGVDKGSGLKMLAEMEGFNLMDVLAIGDSSGDLPFMMLAGIKACPANASDAVKSISDYVSPYSTTEGVIDIIQNYNGVHD